MTTRAHPLHYFSSSFVVTAIGLALGALVGFREHGTLAGVVSTVLIVGILAVLETSLSFDNAVVNASVLRDMTPLWRHRFLTWGIAIAVFGMRLLFPLAVVSIVASIGPLAALQLALFRPEEYARILHGSHHLLGAFGGAFLGMVCLRFFFDAEKDVHWLKAVEARLARVGRIYAAELGIMLLTVYGFSRFIAHEEREPFLVAGLFGLVAFIAVDGIAAALDVSPERLQDAHRASAASFLYLEVLDASFSFDGVIGAFALTHNLFVIAIGLGIGAMFVRSLTVMLVEEGTLTSYRYLENGAFWAIGALALLMLVDTVADVPDAVTGAVGAVLIALSLWSSVRYKRRARQQTSS